MNGRDSIHNVRSPSDISFKSQKEFGIIDLLMAWVALEQEVELKR
jgi:hypothetical protein